MAKSDAECRSALLCFAYSSVALASCCGVLRRAAACCGVLWRAVACCGVLWRAVPCGAVRVTLLIDTDSPDDNYHA